MALEAYRRALKTGETFDKSTKLVVIGQDRVVKTSIGRYLDSVEKKTRGTEKGDVPHEKKKAICFG